MLGLARFKAQDFEGPRAVHTAGMAKMATQLSQVAPCVRALAGSLSERV